MWQGNLRKMLLEAKKPIHYSLNLSGVEINLNALLGKQIALHFLKTINCLHCQREINKSFNSGYCFPCFRRLAICDICIVRPNLCHFHHGTCREPNWAQQYCRLEHIVYLSQTSTCKVGISKATNLPTRWLDQGAVAAKVLYQVGNRYTAGLIEKELTRYVADKTNWRNMLLNKVENVDLNIVSTDIYNQANNFIHDLRSQCVAGKPHEILQIADSIIHKFNYPVTEYPIKIKSLNLEKTPYIEGKLLGMKGQYLILDCGVLNIRKYGGYLVQLNLI